MKNLPSSSTEVVFEEDVWMNEVERLLTAKLSSRNEYLGYVCSLGLEKVSETSFSKWRGSISAEWAGGLVPEFSAKERGSWIGVAFSKGFVFVQEYR